MWRELLGDAANDDRDVGGYEWLRGKEFLDSLEKIDRVNALLSPLFKAKVYESVLDRLPDLGFNAAEVKGLVFNPFEGQIHTG